jgi:hypothetical protein
VNRGATLIMAALAAAAVLSSFACQWQWGENGLARLEQLNATPDGGASSPPPDGGAFDTGAPPPGSGCALPDDADAGSAGAPSTSCVGLTSGQWAVRLVQFENIATLGDNLTLTDLFLAKTSSDATSLELTFCGEESSLTSASAGLPETLGENSIPPPLVNAVAATPLAVPLPGNGEIRASGVVWLWGLQNLANPATDPLPTSADAGTVWDEDMDGNPGVTVDVVSPPGELYLVKRVVFDFAQSTSAGGWLTGSLEATSAQETLGASSPLLDTNVAITPRSGCTSLYQVRCVDPGFTCASLVQGYQTLFVGAPASP